MGDLASIYVVDVQSDRYLKWIMSCFTEGTVSMTDYDGSSGGDL